MMGGMDGAALVVTVDEGLDEILDDHQWGQLTVWRIDSGVGYQALTRPGLDDEQLATFTQWALSAIRQFQEPGDPQAKGWNSSARGEGYWYMTAARYELPSFDN